MGGIAKGPKDSIKEFPTFKALKLLCFLYWRGRNLFRFERNLGEAGKMFVGEFLLSWQKSLFSSYATAKTINPFVKLKIQEKDLNSIRGADVARTSWPRVGEWKSFYSMKVFRSISSAIIRGIWSAFSFIVAHCEMREATPMEHEKFKKYLPLNKIILLPPRNFR